ncbi:MAG: 50S ribosomal protein L37ae [Candidatus Woesearchaeota archaeon]
MAKINTGSIKRFGTRYGRTPKLRFGEIEKEQRKLHKCPFCNQIKVKRIAVGIWQCSKCENKFTGKAYTLAKKKRSAVESESKEESVEELDEQEDESEESDEETFRYSEKKSEEPKKKSLNDLYEEND